MPDLVENTLVDGRYRIGDRLGSGGMADVYAAEDSHLGRHVALKILHRRFARDESFVERFRREASSAASLQHPNIVGIFDRGEYDGTYYIAMEHLRGASLKEIVDAESPSPQLRTIDIGVQILEAAAHAHAHGVIHRDFKPHNVIVNAEGRAKVTDFGIARAGASEVTETGSIMGTAHYLSPEQAQGQRVTAASDIYSIGVVLYEMLAGHVPFQGESAVSIALKHLSEEPAPISAVRPDVHPLLEAAVMRALVKDPAERHADANAFADALREAREAIVAEGGDVVVERVAVVPPATPDPVEEDDESRRRRWPWILLVLLALGALAVGLWALFFRGDTLPVPDVVGQDLPGARAALERRGLEVAVRRRPDPAPAGEVVAQRPGARAEVEEGSTITLAVSRGPGRRSVPSVRRLSERAAVARLNRAGFRVESATRASADVPAKLTIGTDPRVGTEIAVGDRVRLFISSGPRQVEVPRVVGLSRGAAESTLSRRGFAVDAETTTSDAPEDEVIEQAPGEGTTADDGSTVTLTVSAGPPDEPAPRAAERDERPTPRSDRSSPSAKVDVPDVQGRSEDDAAAALRRAGFRVNRERVTRTDPDEDGEVLRQSPGGGSRRRAGTTVTIIVGRVEAPTDPAPAAP